MEVSWFWLRTTRIQSAAQTFLFGLPNEKLHQADHIDVSKSSLTHDSVPDEMSVDVVFKWNQSAIQTPRLFVVDGAQLMYAGAMLIKSSMAFDCDEESESHFETTLVSFFLTDDHVESPSWQDIPLLL